MLFYGNKRKSRRRKFIAKVGNEEYIFGYDKNGILTFCGRYDEKNDQHKHLKKINLW